MKEHPRSRFRNLRRTWEVRMDAGWGDSPSATVFLGRHTICACFGDEGRVTVQMDGESISVEQATSYLTDRQNRVRLLSEGVIQPSEMPALPEGPTIGKARACTLHRIMGRLGLPQGQHSSLAAAALGEWAPVPSLADLSEREARTVWNHLRRLYPSAPEVAATLSADHAI